jgi:hypothetical protein
MDPEGHVKITWKDLQSDSFADPGCVGTDYALRYRHRKAGIFAELRFRAGPCDWRSYALGQLPSEAELAARLPPVRIYQRGELIEEKRPPVPIEHAVEPVRQRAWELLNQLRSGHDPRGGVPRDSLRALIDAYLRHRSRACGRAHRWRSRGTC